MVIPVPFRAGLDAGYLCLRSPAGPLSLGVSSPEGQEGEDGEAGFKAMERQRADRLQI